LLPDRWYERNDLKNNKIKSVIKWTAFLAYIAVLVYFVFFAEMFGRTHLSTEYRYNLVPFKEIMRFITYYKVVGGLTVFLNIAGNVLAFMPLGFFLPLVSEHKMAFWSILCTSCALSVAIELVQLITKVGTCDVDDVLLNTLGGILGYGVYKTFEFFVRRKNGEQP